MRRVTRFAARDPGPAARVSGFLAHLRLNGFRLGVAEAETALRALAEVRAADPVQARRALKAVCAVSAEEAERFDALFDSFWLSGGRVRQKAAPTSGAPNLARPGSGRTIPDVRSEGEGRVDGPEGPDGGADSASEGTGRLVASTVRALMKKDLREVVSPEDIRIAEQVALRLGAALRDRRSRRRRVAPSGRILDIRRTVRRSLATGGDPFRLVRRRRPDRPARIVALCDVSGSMALYARPYLAFLAGLTRARPGATEAYVFHTRLVRITDALRDDDPLGAMSRLAPMVDGFGGGSRIGGALQQFASAHARRFVDARTVVLILSDGYDSGPPEPLGAALERLRKRGCRIVWLNPLKGWKHYAPVARGMAAALPHLDLFAAANTLESLAALESELARL